MLICSVPLQMAFFCQSVSDYTERVFESGRCSCDSCVDVDRSERFSFASRLFQKFCEAELQRVQEQRKKLAAELQEFLVASRASASLCHENGGESPPNPRVSLCFFFPFSPCHSQRLQSEDPTETMRFKTLLSFDLRLGRGL